MTYATLSFGWKASPFIYQSIGICVTSYLRSLNVMNSLSIDDSFVVTKEGNPGLFGTSCSGIFTHTALLFFHPVGGCCVCATCSFLNSNPKQIPLNLVFPTLLLYRSK